jgi:GT2 family glycosyltransferase
MLAPIIIFAYNRPEHLRKTLDYLVENYLYRKSNIYVFVDRHPDGHLTASPALKNADNVIYRDVHYGLSENIIEGVTEVINKYGKAIIVEDDLITSPYFLTYMNNCLDAFENRKYIMSISGYCPPINIKSKDSIFLSHRPGSWGWATWQDRWENFIPNYTHIDREFKKHFNQGGNDLSITYRKAASGLIDSWLIRWAFSHALYQKYAIYPVKSLVKNIGLDGSGEHCRNKRVHKFDVDINEKFNPVINKEVERNHSILKEFKKLHDLNKLRYLRQLIRLWN